MELTSLQKNIIKVMQSEYFDEKGAIKFPTGMYPDHFRHLLDDFDEQKAMLVESIVALEAAGLVSIGDKIISNGRDNFGTPLDVALIRLTPAGMRF